MDAAALRFDPDGAQRFERVLEPERLATLEAALSSQPIDRAGVRLREVPGLEPFFAPDGPVGTVASSLLGPGCRPVRAVLFDKTAAANWSLAWHQDRTIVVAERRAAQGFGPWSVKDGLIHVASPQEILDRMVTLRVHLDPVGPTNAPLMVSPGSHRLGRVTEGQIEAAVARCGTATCLAEAGDIWAYSTPILHASAAAATPMRRRVLQVDFATGGLPAGLQWRGV